MKPLYPIRLRPILKEKMWGGNALKERFGKKAGKGARIGESWEICGMPDENSLVTNGYLKGNTLEEIAEVYMDELLGESVYDRYGTEFPLLIKFIDANERLSIQVHPDDKIAGERHHAWGKTEMWYVVDAKPGAVIYTGFRKKITKEEYLGYLSSGKMEDIINATVVRPGDVFFIPAGLVHAIGSGVLLTEIQQTSDITYRIYDWGRVDDVGKQRELHTSLALDAIDYSHDSTNLLRISPELNRTILLAESPYFRTSLISFNSPIIKDYSLTDSFIIYICTESMAVVECFGHSEEIRAGETLLIPASADSVTIIPQGRATLLEVYVPKR